MLSNFDWTSKHIGIGIVVRAKLIAFFFPSGNHLEDRQIGQDFRELHQIQFQEMFSNY